MADNQIKELQDGLKSAHDRVIQAIAGISEEDAHQVPAEDEWTVAQLLAHITEIQDFWTGKALLITREDNPNITRSDVENDRRQAAVTDHSGDSLADLAQAAVNANRRAIELVGAIRPELLDRPGYRGEGNPVTAGGVVRYLTRHVEEHARQIIESRRLISAAR